MKIRTKIPHIASTLIFVALFGSVLALTNISVTKNIQPVTNKKQTKQPVQQPAVEGATTCAVDAKLVNACRPWTSVATNNYSMAPSDRATQFAFSDKRLNDPNVLINPNMAVTITKAHDFYHSYHPAGSNTLDSTEIATANKPGFYAQVNWKPNATWGPAGGGDATVNANIDKMANSIKSVAPKKILLAVFHEPEDDVSVGNCTASKAGAAAGSPAQYVQMWRNVRARFDALGVNNVVWSMNYMGYLGWNCLAPSLWPGNSYVDWVTWDPYGGGTSLFNNSVNNFYSYLTQNSSATHDYLSKPWGLAEFGYNNRSGNSTQANAIAYWNEAKTAMQNNAFPKIKLYSVFDTSVNGTSQVGYDFTGAISVPEQTAYNGFVSAILAKDSSQPPADTVNPVITFSTPANNASVKGPVTILASASDNVAVTKVLFYVDSTLISTDTNAADNWQTSWTSTSVADGAHTLKAVASDAAGNSATVTRAITVANTVPPPAPTISSFTAAPTSITVGATSKLTWVTANSVSCSVSPGGPTDTTQTTWTTLTQSSTGTKTFTLTCKNSANVTVSKTVNFTVNPAPTPPSNVVLSASTNAVSSGSSVSLNWTSTGSSSCTLNPGAVTASGTSSSYTVTNLTATTTYKVTCTNSAGNTDSNAVTVTVTATPQPPAKPVITSFTATPTSIIEGNSVTLAWQASNVAGNGCSLAPSPLSSTAASGQWVSGALTASMSYTLTCKNSANDVTSKSVSVTVGKTPVPKPPPEEKPGDIDAEPVQTSDPIVTSNGGQEVVALDVSGSLTEGMLGTLDSTTITDESKVGKVQRVEFYIGEELVQTVTEPPFAFDSTGMEVGSYTITQRTYFDDGSTTEKSQIIEVMGAATSRPSQPVAGSGPRTALLIAGAVLTVAAIATFAFLRLTGRLGSLRRLIPFGKKRIVSYRDYDTTTATFIAPNDVAPTEINPTIRTKQ